MKRLKSLFILSLILLCFIPEASAVSQQAVADSLMTRLKYQKTAQDSLRLLYDIFDASDRRNKKIPGNMVLDVAARNGDQLALIDFIPQMAVIVKLDSDYDDKLLNYAEGIEDKTHRLAVQTFVQVMRASEEANYIPEKELRAALLKYAEEDMTPKVDNVYANILDLYRMVIFLGTTSRGNLYLEYLTRLEKLIDSVPEDLGYFRNLFYTTAANVHTRNGNHAKAIEADRNLIESTKRLEERYERMGRKYRNLKRYYYISYRRMLSNYKALTLPEINDLYQKCKELADSDAEIRADFYGEGRPEIYRLMAEGQYKELVPRIKNALNHVRDNYTRRRLLGMLVTAADSVNDKETLLSALKSYNTMLQERVDEQSEEAYSELQIRYDIDQLKAERNALALEKKDAEMATNQKVITVALIGVLLLAVVLMFLYRSNFTLRRSLRDVKGENTKLRTTMEDMLGESAVLHGTLNVRQSDPKIDEAADRIR